MDRRVLYTKKMITDTFLQLLSYKDIKKITVSEICKEADINRATFYRYYLDVYDLLDHIQTDFVNDLKRVVDTEGKYSVSSFTKEFLMVFLQNKDLVKVLFNFNNHVYYLNELLEIAYTRCREKWQMDLPNVSEEDIDYAAIYIFNGALGVINFWVKNDFDKDVDEIANIIERLSYYGTKRFIYKV